MQIRDADKTVKNKKSAIVPLDMSQWSEIIKQWDKTKESLQAYCQRINFSYNTFYYVRMKLNRKNKSAQKFIPVSVQTHPSMIGADGLLLLENKNRLQLKIPLSIQESTPINLLKLLGWTHA